MNSSMFILANTILCGSVMFTCLCRQAASNKTVLRRVRFGYSALGSGALACLIGPYYGEIPGWSTLAVLVGVLALLFSGSHRWRGAAPPDVRSDWVDLPKPKR